MAKPSHQIPPEFRTAINNAMSDNCVCEITANSRPNRPGNVRVFDGLLHTGKSINDYQVCGIRTYDDYTLVMFKEV